VCFLAAAAAVAGVVVLSAFTSWWVLFGLFAVPPVACSAAMLTTGASFARFGAEMPCASWWRDDIARATPAR
jgi:formate hydrogenlyase subunit 4